MCIDGLDSFKNYTALVSQFFSPYFLNIFVFLFCRIVSPPGFAREAEGPTRGLQMEMMLFYAGLESTINGYINANGTLQFGGSEEVQDR